jgi:hypothetical protein
MSPALDLSLHFAQDEGTAIMNGTRQSLRASLEMPQFRTKVWGSRSPHPNRKAQEIR